MSEQILFVDDESAALEGYKRILHKDFQVNSALSGEEGLAAIGNKGSYAVVVSDMRMPGMDGVQFLARVREISPQTVRVILTGHADIECAMNAVNEDAVFRFLTKPCDPSVLKKTLTACLLQYQLIRAERELLENTLMGSIKLLTDVLSLANPAAFGRSLRINRYVQHMVRELQLDAPWRYEAAAMLSQVGCISLEPEVLEAAYRGGQLTAEEQVTFNMHPAVARDLLANIPRLEGIAWIVGQQFGSAYAGKNISDSLKTGAVILRVAIAFDKLKMQGRSDLQAIAELHASGNFDLRIVRTLETVQLAGSELETVVDVSALQPGMILSEEIRSSTGLLLASKGQEVSHPLVVRLRNFHRHRAIKDKVAVLVAKPLISADRLQTGQS
jgi:response regulator RpfG family c-di-GMP phosphodiesterase